MILDDVTVRFNVYNLRTGFPTVLVTLDDCCLTVKTTMQGYQTDLETF